MISDAVPVSMVMTQEDAVEMKFDDGSKIHLSPCGSNFVYTPSLGCSVDASHAMNTKDSLQTSVRHPLYATRGIYQRTSFATSSYRSKVTCALEFRNKFANHPYLCATALQDEKPVELHADITHAQWPVTAEQCHFEHQLDQSIHLTSKDSLATIALSSAGQDISFKYLCKLPTKRTSCNERRSQCKQCRDTRCGYQHTAMQGQCVGSVQSPSGQGKLCASGDMLMGHKCSAGLDDRVLELEQHKCNGTGYGTAAEASISVSESEDCIAHSRPLHSNSSEGKQCNIKQSMDPDTCHCMADNQSHIMAEQAGAVQGCRRKFLYVWVVQNYSVAHCPWFLREVVGMMLQHQTQRQQTLGRSSQGRGIAMCHGNERGYTDERRTDAHGDTLSTPLPQSLPLSCDHSHLHRHQPRASGQQTAGLCEDENDILIMYGRKLKVLVSCGVVYRFFWDSAPSIEIHVGNGSVLLSCDERGSYYRLIRVDPDGRQREQMISSTTPPPDTPASKHSIASMVRRGSRFLQCMGVTHRLDQGRSDTCCWQVQKEDELCERAAMTGYLIERSSIPGIGQLEAFSCGLLRGVFCDGITVEMETDSVETREGSIHVKKREMSTTCVPVCRATLEDGSVRRINLQHPATFSRYVTVLQDWNERMRGHSRLQAWRPEEPKSSERRGLIEAELIKIQSFTHIVDLQCSHDGARNPALHMFMTGTTSDKREETTRRLSREVTPYHAQERWQFTDAEIQMALQKTTETISAIETYLTGRK